MAHAPIGFRGGAAVVVAAIVATGLGLAAPPAGAADPGLAVSPATGLLDQQIVMVTGTGFAAGEDVLVTQCIGSVPDDCAMDPVVNTNGALAVADASGAISATLRLPRVLDLPSGGGGSCADGACAIVAIRRADTVERARQAIDFEATGTAPPPAPPTLSASTVEARHDGSTVALDGAGFLPW